MKNKSARLAASIAVLCLAAKLAPAQQIVVDPDGVGATDVDRYTPGIDSAIPLQNPLSSPLNLLSFNTLRVGVSDAGEILIADGGIVTAGEAENGEGLITVTGAGSRLSLERDFRVGAERAGAFDSDVRVLAGAEIEARDIRIGLLNQSNSSVVVDGVGSRLTSTGQQIVVGPTTGSQSILNVRAGGAVSTNELIIGATDGQLGSEADVLVEGAGSILSADEISVGAVSVAGLGTLWVRDGARVEVDTLLLNAYQQNNGTRRVAGTVFVSGGGTLHIESNFRLQTPTLSFAGGTLSLGGDHSYTGLEGGDSNLPTVLNARNGRLSNNETLKIAGNLDLRTGLTIDGATLSAGSITNIPGIDLVRGTLELTATDVQVTASGPFGDTLTLNADQHLSVLQSLNVQAGGRVQLEGGRLGGGTFTNSGLITGGGRIDGAFTNAAAGQVRLAAGDRLRFTGQSSVNHGEIRLLGSNLLEFDHQLTNSATGVITGRGAIVASDGFTNQGQLRFSGGATDVEGNLTSSGSIEVLGASTATFYDHVTNTGNLSIGPGSRAVFFGDAMLQGGSNLGIQIAESTQNALEVLGGLSLGGQLSISISGGYQPSLGDRVLLATAVGGIAGAFDSWTAPNMPGGLTFDLNVTSTLIELKVVTATLTNLAGDYNNDGIVDLADYTVWRDQLGVPASNLLNDVDGGTVGAAQYGTWKANFGARITAPLALSASVPEPGTLLLVLAGMALAVVLRLSHFGRSASPRTPTGPTGTRA